MFKLRPLLWPDDRSGVRALDTSYSTDRIFSLKRTERSLSLEEISISPPLHKSYPLADEMEGLATFDWTHVAASEDGVVGLAAMRYEEWNRRALLYHLYVAASARRMGVGGALVMATLAEARRRNARCLWAETQTTNYGAIRFYESSGFTWCGLDTSLYDPTTVDPGEIALFFSRSVE